MLGRDRRAARRRPGTGAKVAPFLIGGAAALLPALLPLPVEAQITAIQEIKPLDFGDEEPYPFFVYGITVFGGVATYDMQQMNEALKAVNDSIGAQGTAVQFDTVTRGGAIGAGFRAILADRYFLTADYERTISSTKIGGVTSESRVRIPADIISASVGYDFLASRTTRFGFGVGLGWYRSGAEQIITETPPGQDTRELGRILLKGSTVGPHYQGFFEARFTERLFVGVVAGYRTAKISSLEVSGLDDLQPPITGTGFISIPIVEERPDETVTLRGGGDSLDYSGFFGRAALTFYLNIPTF